MTEPVQFGSRYTTTRETWEHIWDTASIERELELMQVTRAQATMNTYTPYLNKGGIHLEAGSGLSAVVITLRKMGYNMVGLDYAENALHTSQAYDSSLPLLVGDVHALHTLPIHSMATSHSAYWNTLNTECDPPLQKPSASSSPAAF